MEFAAHAESLAQLDAGRDDEGEEKSAQYRQVKAGEVLPIGLSGRFGLNRDGLSVRLDGDGRRRFGFIKGRVEHEAEENALEDIFGLKPTHGGCRSTGRRRVARE